jgi:hypothetical protein
MTVEIAIMVATRQILHDTQSLRKLDLCQFLRGFILRSLRSLVEEVSVSLLSSDYANASLLEMMRL